MTDFGVSATLDIGLASGTISEIEDELESINGEELIFGGSAGGLGGFAGGGAAGSAVTDGGIGELASLQSETIDLLEEIEDDLAGGVGGGGGGGLTVLPGGLPGGGGKGGLFSRLFSASSAATVVASGQFGKGGIQDPTGGSGEFDGPLGQFRAAFEGIKTTFGPLVSPGQTGEAGIDTAQDVTGASLDIAEGLGFETTPQWLKDYRNALDKTPDEPNWVSQLQTILDGSGGGDGDGGGSGTGRPSSQAGPVGSDQRQDTQLPDYFTEANKEAIREQQQRRNRAKENRQTKPTVNNTNDVTVEVNANIRNTRELEKLLNNPERWVRDNLNISSVGRGP